jgi:VanZ family protein
LRRTRALLALGAYGAAIEVLQRFVPGRTSDWADLFADSVGLLSGVLLAMSWEALEAARRPRPLEAEDSD